MSKTMPLPEFIRNATAKEIKALASAGGTSVDYLYQLSGQHRKTNFVRTCNMVRVSHRLARASDGRLLPLDGSSVCRDFSGHLKAAKSLDRIA